MPAAKSGSKKRKRDASPDTLTFDLSTTKAGQPGPSLVCFPVVRAPLTTSFKTYAKKKQKTVDNGSVKEKQKEAETDQSDILLVGECDTVEFVSNEEETRKAAGSGCRYILATYDRGTGKLRILPQSKSPHILVHTVKALKSLPPSATPSRPEYLEARTALGEKFGTKKAKAAIRAQERNHVDVGAMEGVMTYVMDSIDKGAEGLMTTEDAKTTADSNRLIPPFSATATDPADVYPLHSIIPEVEWKSLSTSAFDSTKSEAEHLALLPHRYSAWIKHHLNTLVHESGKSKKKNLKILLYISSMLAFRQATARKEIDKDNLYEKLAPLPNIVADSLLSRFTEVPRGSTSHQSTPSTKTSLLTHIFALCLKLDKFATDTEILAQDLSMKPSEVNQLFKSLGCKMVKLGERERTRLGLPDSSAGQKRAVLTAPVDFPKVRLRRKT